MSGLSPSSPLIVASIANPREVKRPRSIQDGDISNHDAKCPKRNDEQLQSSHSKDESIMRWLSASGWSRRTSTDNRTLLQKASDNMPQKSAGILSSPCVSGTSEKSGASVDIEYIRSLRYRNVFINPHDPPKELKRRAEPTLSRSVLVIGDSFPLHFRSFRRIGIETWFIGDDLLIRPSNSQWPINTKSDFWVPVTFGRWEAHRYYQIV